MKKILLILGVFILLSNSITVNAASSDKVKDIIIDLHAPFSTDDLSCRTVIKPKGTESPFVYEDITVDEIENCKNNNGQIVQRIKIKSDSENMFMEIITEYLTPLIKFVFGIGILFSVIMIISGGIKVIAAGDDSNAVSDAHNKIISGIIGITIFVLSGFILHMINPIFFKFVS